MSYMNKEKAIEFVKNKIINLKDDLDHEECVEQDLVSVNNLKKEVKIFENVFNYLTDINKTSEPLDAYEFTNTLHFIRDKIYEIEELVKYEEDTVRKYTLESDLDEYLNIRACINYKMLKRIFGDE